MKPKITPFLWFNDNAEEAAKFYKSVFKKSKITKVTRYDKETAKRVGPPAGSVLTVEFEIEGQQFLALNGGRTVDFNESISFVVNCKNQREIDYYWKKLTGSGGKEVACGWLTDKFGVSWQVVPKQIEQWLSDPKRSARVMAAVMQMMKLDIKKLKDAYEGKTK